MRMMKVSSFSLFESGSTVLTAATKVTCPVFYYFEFTSWLLLDITVTVTTWSGIYWHCTSTADKNTRVCFYLFTVYPATGDIYLFVHERVRVSISTIVKVEIRFRDFWQDKCWCISNYRVLTRISTCHCLNIKELGFTVEWNYYFLTFDQCQPGIIWE